MKLNRTTLLQLVRANELLDKLHGDQPKDVGTLYGYKVGEASERLCAFLETATQYKQVDPFWNADLVEGLAQDKLKKDLQYATCIDEDEEEGTYTLRIMEIVDDLEKDVDDYYFRGYRFKEDVIEDVEALRDLGYRIIP